MDQTNQLHKKIGILLGIVAVLAVGAVTFLNEKATPDQASVSSVVSSNNSQDTSQPSSQTLSQNSSQTQTQNSSQTQNYNNNEDDNEDTNSQRPNNTPVDVQTTPAPAVVPKQTTASSAKTSFYKNGTYTANGSYSTPEGQVAINVSVTLVNDIITDSNVTSVSGERTSIRYQNNFISAYKQYVIGKNIASVRMSKISGSSLTPIGFNNALATIKAQAKS